ncbi:hypothetical protein LIER_36840 [Lithospermum erythrorhizon]|uniref:Uncharacterized protein n=1 Tax=Lithospermum erythrorhizon TaxID=34254 RepID=A0AAV3PBJ6_LITER
MPKSLKEDPIKAIRPATLFLCIKKTTSLSSSSVGITIKNSLFLAVIREGIQSKRSPSTGEATLFWKVVSKCWTTELEISSLSVAQSPSMSVHAIAFRLRRCLTQE